MRWLLKRRRKNPAAAWVVAVEWVGWAAWAAWTCNDRRLRAHRGVAMGLVYKAYTSTPFGNCGALRCIPHAWSLYPIALNKKPAQAGFLFYSPDLLVLWENCPNVTTLGPSPRKCTGQDELLRMAAGTAGASNVSSSSRTPASRAMRYLTL